MDVKKLLGRGYLPETLPRSFSSESYAAISESLEVDNRFTSAARFNLTRPGGLRRTLSIPNPMTQLVVARQIASGWSQLLPVYDRSGFSLSKPTEDTTGHRTLVPSTPFGGWTEERTKRMHRARFSLESDVSQFYNSIYTHAIPWALVGKTAEKKRLRERGDEVLGNWIDNAVRRGQEGQTRGIPIGPDTSLVIAELLLCDVDSKLQARFPQMLRSATRRMDDLHVFTSSRSEAEEILLAWESELAAYELLLNPDKTRIIEGPAGVQTPWRTRLTQFVIRDTDTKAANDLRDYFGLAFDLARDYPTDAVVSYAIAALRNTPFQRRGWSTLVDMLLPAAIAEPSSLRFVNEALARGRAQGVELDRDKIAETLSDIVAHHASLEHSADVSWALWVLIENQAKLTSEAVSAAVKMEDSVSLLLLRFLSELGLAEGADPDFREVEARATSPEALTGRDWLIAYEFAAHGWVESALVEADPFFKELLEAGVQFFNPRAALASDGEGGSKAPTTTPEGEPRADSTEGEEPDDSDMPEPEPDVDPGYL